MVCQAERIGPYALIASLLKQSAVRWQPNNSLKLTRRAGPSGMLFLPAGLAKSLGCIARFRRAA